MNKLEMAHEYAMKHLENSKGNITMASLTAFAWQYADAMQAEAEKRNYSEKQDSSEWQPDSVPTEILKHDAWRKSWQRENIKPSLEWQPDWSQAPKGSDAWRMYGDGNCAWLVDIDGDFKWWAPSPSFDYQGNWQDSLRKRPQ